MTACPIRYQRQVSDRKGKIFYTSITSLSHISKCRVNEMVHFLLRFFRKSHASDCNGRNFLQMIAQNSFSHDKNLLCNDLIFAEFFRKASMEEVRK